MDGIWTDVPFGLHSTFSPSGAKLAFWHAGALKIQRTNGDEQVLLERVNVYSLSWASEDIIAFGTSDGHGPILLKAVATDSGEVRLLFEVPGTYSITRMPIRGCVSYLGWCGGRKGLFQVDVSEGIVQRLSCYDFLFELLDVSCASGHTWSPDGSRLALVGRRHGVVDEENGSDGETESFWRKLSADPKFKDIYVVHEDGMVMNGQEFANAMKHTKPSRLYIIKAEGECIEVPDSNHAQNPLWSPDGSILVFQKGYGFQRTLWLLHPESMTVERLGDYFVPLNPVLHPSGALYYYIVTEEEFKEFGIRKIGRWHTVWLERGEVREEKDM